MNSIISFFIFSFMFISVHLNLFSEKQKNDNKPPVSSGHITVDGTDLNYTVEGKGMPCLVIGSSIYYPRTFSKELRNHLKFYFVDMRWFAKNYSPVNLADFTLQTITDDIEKVRSELKLKKIIILGHSIHGTIAFEYAKRHPDKVSHIIMIGSPDIAGNKEQEDAIDSLWKTASDDRRKIQNKNWKILADMKNLSPAQSDVETYCLMGPEYWYDATYDARWLWKDMTIHSDLLHHLYDTIFINYYMFRDRRNVPVPTYVALGKYDYVDPYTLWNGHDDIPGLTKRIFEKSGHTPQLEQPELFDAELMKWIKEN
jgi:proline iminopeptidase